MWNIGPKILHKYLLIFMLKKSEMNHQVGCGNCILKFISSLIFDATIKLDRDSTNCNRLL